MKLSSITIELPSGEKLLGAVDMETGNTYTLSPYEIDTKGMVKIEKDKNNGEVDKKIELEELDTSIYTEPEFDSDQMREIRIGLEK